MKGIRLRHIVFTGTSVPPAGMEFDDGLNLLYGASNTGKSFALKSLDFMLGGSTPLPAIERRVDYTSIWLGTIFPDGKPVTLHRAAAGGAYTMYDGLMVGPSSGATGTTLLPVHDATRKDSLSRTLLGSIGMDGKVVAKNMSGEKESLTFRSLIPYVSVFERMIMSEGSPVLASGQVVKATAEKNAFKTLLTGLDDAAVTSTVPEKTRKIAKDAKIELVDEWIAKIDGELGDASPSRAEIVEQTTLLDTHFDDLRSELTTVQSDLDEQIQRRRHLFDRKDQLAARIHELEVTISNFEGLREIYDSDIRRLDALDEGGALIMAIAGRDCPVCGAAPSAQKHSHGLDEIEIVHASAKAERRKIELERRDLSATISSLAAEQQGLKSAAVENVAQLDSVDRILAELRPKEGTARKRHEAVLLRRSELGNLLMLYDRRDEFAARKAQLEARTKRVKGEKLVVGIDGNTAFALSTTIQDVLEAWGFPEARKAQFDMELQDIRVAGKERSANGKGVRAVLHAVFKVAVLVYCHENEKPHPGFVVLDTPLLTYRPPMLLEKYGELEPDEIRLREFGIVDRFYRHLLSLSDIGQFFVIENVDPPSFASDRGKVEIFTGRANEGRMGLFLPLSDTIFTDLAA